MCEAEFHWAACNADVLACNWVRVQYSSSLAEMSASVPVQSDLQFHEASNCMVQCAIASQGYIQEFQIGGKFLENATL